MEAELKLTALHNDCLSQSWAGGSMYTHTFSLTHSRTHARTHTHTHTRTRTRTHTHTPQVLGAQEELISKVVPHVPPSIASYFYRKYVT